MSVGALFSPRQITAALEAMGLFMQNPKDNLAKAQTYYSSKHPG